MHNKTIIGIIILATLSFAGIVFIQSLWLKNAVQLKEEELETIAKNLAIEKLSTYSFGEDVFHTATHSEFHHLQPSQKNAMLISIKKSMDSVFQSNGIYDAYEAAILPCDNGEVLYSNAASLNEQFLTSRIKANLNAPDAGCSLMFTASFVFTDKNKFVVSSLGTQFLFFALLLVTLACVFAYIIITLRKQKKFSALKNDFINNMTHELKTPIASIRLASRMLKRVEGFSEKQFSYMQLIEAESCRLENQVDKVLQTAHLDSGNFQLQKTSVDVHEVIGKVYNNFKMMVESQQGSIQLELSANSPVIYADEVHFTNVIYNLLDNAVKYCSKPPEIIIMTKDGKDGITISVKDNGIGISPKAQAYVFEKFYRVQTGDVHTVKGFGLGLSYVKSIIDAHKGLVSIKSEVNKGSEFKLFFPGI